MGIIIFLIHACTARSTKLPVFLSFGNWSTLSDELTAFVNISCFLEKGRFITLLAIS